MAFDAHGFVDEEAQAFGEAVMALLGEELKDVVQEFRIGVVGHVWFGVGCVCRHPNREPTWPAPLWVGELILFNARQNPPCYRAEKLFLDTF